MPKGAPAWKAVCWPGSPQLCQAPHRSSRAQHAIIQVLLSGSGNEGCWVPAVITAWRKRTGAASKPNYKVCSRTPSCPAPFLWGWLEGGAGEFMEKPAQTGAAVLGEWRADSLGLCCFEMVLAPPPAPPSSKFPPKAQVRNGQRNQTRLLFPPSHQRPHLGLSTVHPVSCISGAWAPPPLCHYRGLVLNCPKSHSQ